MKLLEARQAQIWFEYYDYCKRGSSMHSVELSLAQIPVTAYPFTPVTWLNWTIPRDVFTLSKQSRPHHVPVIIVTSFVLYTTYSITLCVDTPLNFVNDFISVSGLAQLFKMCKPGNGNLNQDIGLQTAFAVEHETGHKWVKISWIIPVVN